ncbi:CBS and ACT domain-containing protein [Pseudobacteroides cellulosolvens]|uniref:Putative signal transduction protein with CBS domain containing protein n=1 Tax=Pseudobacteroides cellulosolvens ATCC 35603 = DSM 2933 TaxID=398512 RepID=A0A0L6JQA1_9FIRM|nr:CBS and ACT domain-containing protein [Pseudobacteroides cellulosolvens]KNY27865.1 putative signal transduction protein with CBS domain containing protein [Pseudobacteroides cellulosolvens ATCC 35603 = DSM 2933]
MYVKSKMTSNPYTISPDATIAEALELMRHNGIRKLPVVKGEELVGIVTEREMLEVSPSKATTLSVFEVNYLLGKTKVSQVMTKDVVTITADSLLEEAALLMRDNNISTLPVLVGEKLCGIITETDIFNAFIELMGFSDIGARIAVEAQDSPGILADITHVIKEYGVNITHIAIYGGESGSSDVVIRVNTQNTDEMVKTLENHGYKVISVLKNNPV